MNRIWPAALLAALVAGPSVARDRDDVPAATPTGKPLSCVGIRQLGESRVRNDRVIDFVRTRDTGYRVVLPDACPGLGFNRAFTYQTSLGQLCAQDIITVLDTGTPLVRSASCGLAEFQPVRFAERR